jgi:hypothetical protein
LLTLERALISARRKRKPALRALVDKEFRLDNIIGDSRDRAV